MSDAVAGFGTLLKMGDGATPEVFTTVAEVKDIGGPAYDMDIIETTHQTSPGAWKEYIAGLLDAGEVTFPTNFLPGNATHDHLTGLMSRLLARQKTNFRLVWPTGDADDQVKFPALVQHLEPSAPINDPLSQDVTLKVTGQPTFGA